MWSPKGWHIQQSLLWTLAESKQHNARKQARTWQTDALVSRWLRNPELEPRRCCPAVTATDRKLLLSIKTKEWIRTREWASQIWNNIKLSVWLLSQWRDSDWFHDSLGKTPRKRTSLICTFCFKRLYHEKMCSCTRLAHQPGKVDKQKSWRLNPMRPMVCFTEPSSKRL